MRTTTSNARSCSLKNTKLTGYKIKGFENRGSKNEESHTRNSQPTPRIIGKGDFRKRRCSTFTEKSSNSAVTIATIRSLFHRCLFTKCARFFDYRECICNYFWGWRLGNVRIRCDHHELPFLDVECSSYRSRSCLFLETSLLQKGIQCFSGTSKGRGYSLEKETTRDKSHPCKRARRLSKIIANGISIWTKNKVTM